MQKLPSNNPPELPTLLATNCQPCLDQTHLAVEGRIQMIIQLKDGRKLGFEECGEKSGTAIIMLHGTPGSRVWFDQNDPIVRELELRVICPERPGYGVSDYSEHHSFTSYPDDVRQLADSLGLDGFYVMGVSGGGAFAAACSHFLSERVCGSAVVSSTCPISMIENRRGMSVSNRVAFWLAENFPLGLRTATAISRKLILRNPERYLNEIKGQLCPWDQRVLESPSFRKLATLHLQEAYRQGIQGAIHELRLQTEDWGFNLEDIATPTDVWHGQEDTLAPHFMGEILAQRIKCGAFHSIPDAGHLLSDDPDFRRLIWEKLIDC